MTVLMGCQPTGPAPVEYTVPTAIRRTPTQEPTPTEEPSPTAPPSLSETPTLVPTAPASGEPGPASVPVMTLDGWTIFSLMLGQRVLTPTTGRDAVLWVAPAGPGLGLYMQDLRSRKTQLLAEPANAGECFCRGYRSGDWVVMVEAEPGAAWWEVSALDLADQESSDVATRERVFIGRTEDVATLDALRPSEIAINADGKVVWEDVETEANGSVVQTLRLHDAVTGAASEIVSVRSPISIGQVAMSGNWVVWNQATASEAGTRGDVFAYDVDSDTLFPIGETGRAWEPAIWGTTVVWKHADGPFADGDVFLFDLEAGQGQKLTQDGQVSEVGAGDGFVAWSSPATGTVVLHDLETGADEVIGRGAVGRLAAGANTVVWLLDREPNTLRVAWRK